uniref:UBC core domain-containing protein n=1 Tax=Acrobeloides nanus TaxID=290746 RepID=A0A914CSK7_9BILA
MSEVQATLLLKKQLGELRRNPVDGFSAGLVDDNNIFKWEVLVIGPPDTLYEGGFFRAILDFPKDYPLRPPKMKFLSEIYHPNKFNVLKGDVSKVRTFWRSRDTRRIDDGI